MQPQDPNNQPVNDKATPIQVPASNAMELPKRHSAGKVVLVIILILVLAGVAGAGTWYYMNNRAKNQQSSLQNQITDLTTKVQDLTQQNQTLQAQIDIDLDTQVAINKTIKGFYDDWIKGISANPAVAAKTLATQASNKGYVNAAVVTYLGTATSGGTDPATCASSVPQSYAYTELAKSNNTATATVNFTLKEGKTKAKLSLAPQGTQWQITQITCEQ